jgi:crotonobetainyl-CoA:carnitine CoA-transferase CaiB-like acyl-CoA transferase
VTRPPTLGEHTDSVLADIGYDADAIAALRKDGII